MKTVTALLRSAESLGIALWVEGGQLRYKARQPVSDGMKDRIRKHKAEIISLLSTQTGHPEKPDHPPLPDWCNPHCECFHRLEIPNLPVVQGCYREIDEKNWRWSRLDKMNSCPMVEATRKSKTISGD